MSLSRSLLRLRALASRLLLLLRPFVSFVSCWLPLLWTLVDIVVFIVHANLTFLLTRAVLALWESYSKATRESLPPISLLGLSWRPWRLLHLLFLLRLLLLCTLCFASAASGDSIRDRPRLRLRPTVGRSRRTLPCAGRCEIGQRCSLSRGERRPLSMNDDRLVGNLPPLSTAGVCLKPLGGSRLFLQSSSTTLSLPPSHVLGLCWNKEEGGRADGTPFFFKRTLFFPVAVLVAVRLDNDVDVEATVSMVDERLKPLGGGRVFLQSTSTALSPPPNHALGVCWNKEEVGSADGAPCQPIVKGKYCLRLLHCVCLADCEMHYCSGVVCRS